MILDFRTPFNIFVTLCLSCSLPKSVLPQHVQLIDTTSQPVVWPKKLSASPNDYQLFFLFHQQSPESKALIIDQDGTGFTPVHYAARAGYLQVCKNRYPLFQNGHNFSILLFTCKSALVASFKSKYSFEFRV